MTALIFDCDGVLADTERDGHRPAFNQMFAELGLPVHWSEEDYAAKLAIGGGKERMASMLTDAFVRENGLPADPVAQRELVAGWHRRKTEIYMELVRAGRLPARPGIRRIVDDALAAGWRLAVASTSAEESVRATLEQVVGRERAAHFLVLAGDVVPAKKPDPAIYELAVDRLEVAPADAVVIEDSRNGLLAAVGAGLACLVTVSGYTEGEDMSEAALVVTSLGDPDEPMQVLASRVGAAPQGYVTLGDLAACLPVSAALALGEGIVRTVATTAVENERYFSDLDAVVGDGDFGHSLASGFAALLDGWAELSYDDVSGLLKQSAVVLSSRIGGTSGPIWSTAFLRAATRLRDVAAPSGDDVVAALRAAVEGIMMRGDAALGDKTLLDALVPAVDRLDAELSRGAEPAAAIAAAASAAREGAEATSALVAKRGRASYAGERSRGSLDAGAVGVAVMFEAVSAAWDSISRPAAEGARQ